MNDGFFKAVFFLPRTSELREVLPAMKCSHTAVKYSMWSLALLIFLNSGFVIAGQEKATAKGKARLPGARPVIHAINYESIQQALDALPAEGGVVMLPPGHFEIDQPLVINKGDVLLTGAGSATHIHNKNEEGKDAIAIHPREASRWKA